MGLFSDLIGSAINSAINYNDKDHFFKILCLVIYADSGNASTVDVEIATDLYNTIFNEDMIASQIHKKLKSTYQDMYNSNKSPEEIIEDIENGRIDRNKLKMFFICACYMSLANADNVEKISKKKLYMVYLIKDGFYLDDDEVNDAYIFAKNNFGINGMAYQNMVTVFEAAFEYFENNEFEEDDDDTYLSFSTQKDEAIQDNKNMEISEEDNNEVKTLINLSESYVDNSNYKASIGVLLRATKIRPNDCKIWFRLANSYSFDKQYDKAIDNYLKALELTFFDFRMKSLILTELGDTYSEIGLHQEAIKTLIESNKLNPDNEFTWQSLGKAYNRNGQYKNAIDSLLKSIEITPNYYSVLGLGISYYNDGQYGEAINALLKALELNPDNWGALSVLGNSYYKNGQYKEAIDSSLKSIELNPTVDAWITLCKIYRKNGNIKELKHAIAKAKELNPNLDYGKLIMNELDIIDM